MNGRHATRRTVHAGAAVNSFANPEYFGSAKVRGRRIEVRVDSLRVSVYNPQFWNDLAVRAASRAPDR